MEKSESPARTESPAQEAGDSNGAGRDNLLPKRDAKGRLLPGGPSLGKNGRPRLPRRPESAPYLAIVGEELTPDRWREIVCKAIAQAIAGDADARKWLSAMVDPGVFAKPDEGAGRGIEPPSDKTLSLIILRYVLQAQAARQIELARGAEDPSSEAAQVIDVDGERA
jgi:hypothetical protein